MSLRISFFQADHHRLISAGQQLPCSFPPDVELEEESIILELRHESVLVWFVDDGFWLHATNVIINSLPLVS